MNGFTYNNRTKTRIRNISVAICVSALLAMPVPASAGVFDAVKSRVDSIYSQVRSIRAQMGALISGMNETRDALRGEGARLMLNSVRSMLVFLQESQEQYRNFSGPNDCDAGSPCSEYRESLHGLNNDIIVLPSELPFVEDAPSLGSRLTNATQVIDIVPTFVLYASEQMIGDAVADVRELTGTLRSVAAQLPEIPTLERLDTMSDAAFDEVCEVIDDNRAPRRYRWVHARQHHRGRHRSRGRRGKCEEPGQGELPAVRLRAQDVEAQLGLQGCTGHERVRIALESRQFDQPLHASGSCGATMAPQPFYAIVTAEGRWTRSIASARPQRTR
jgi:hypothetical protein